MRVLFLFIDMLRPNRYGLYNQKLENNKIDNAIIELGGTLYTNCFSPAPDTPRSMASFYTGLSPIENGCNTRVKWPSKFLNKNIETIFDNFLKNEYKLDFFSNPNERKGGLFPPLISDLDVHNNDFNLNHFTHNISLHKNHLIFISIPDFHWAHQDWGYTKKGERIAISETSNSLDIVFNNLNKDDFDHIFLFSDHGFKFNYQIRKESWYNFLNRDRSNIFLFHRAKFDSEIKYDDKLCSIQDLKYTVDEIFGNPNVLSLFSDNQRDYIVCEDHLSIDAPEVNQNVDIWALITKNEVYFRTLNHAILEKNRHIVSENIIPEYDEILKKESQFGRYKDEHEKVFAYHDLILAQTEFMNGNPRKNDNYLHKFYRSIELIKDNINHLFKND